MTTATEATMFDPSSYDLEGTPTLNGQKASSIQLAFESFELDHTDAQHMLLAGQLEDGETLTLTVTAKPSRRSWAERPDADTDRLGRRYTLTIRDVTA
jgi:hypothetical protein